MDTCPNCGYCKHCGRSARPHGFQPYPIYPSVPWWQSPWYGNTAGLGQYNTDGLGGNWNATAMLGEIAAAAGGGAPTVTQFVTKT